MATREHSFTPEASHDGGASLFHLGDGKESNGEVSSNSDHFLPLVSALMALASDLADSA